MGYSYGRSPSGAWALSCDCCGKVGGVRKRKCPIGYCSAPAACAACHAARKEKWAAYHRDNCYPGRERARAEEERRLTTHANDWLAIAAWGSWADGVPAGMVGVVATKAGERKVGLEEKWFLVPESEYTSTPYFVVDLARHQEISKLSGAIKKAA